MSLHSLKEIKVPHLSIQTKFIVYDDLAYHSGKNSASRTNRGLI